MKETNPPSRNAADGSRFEIWKSNRAPIEYFRSNAITNTTTNMMKTNDDFDTMSHPNHSNISLLPHNKDQTNKNSEFHKTGDYSSDENSKNNKTRNTIDNHLTMGMCFDMEFALCVEIWTLF